MNLETLLLVGFVVASVGPYWLLGEIRNRRHRAKLEHSRREGLDQPPSLHPVIDATRCIGTGACVRACPEGDILGLVDGRATLVEPTRCIGHGECLLSCPLDAIELVFGTAKRGIEIPHVNQDFETNVSGLYIAGELGGMGLIRNAMTQGMQVVHGIADELAKEARDSTDDASVLDLLIVGAGPAGLAASLVAKERGLRFETVEQDSIGGTVFHYPRQKLVMTSRLKLPFYGTLNAREITKEKLLEIWMEIVARADLHIRTGERVEGVKRGPKGFVVRTTASEYVARRVVLAIGRRGSPRKLGVPGENSPNVAYSLGDAGGFRGGRMLVVGGGNSALEAASQLADPVLGNDVTLSYRGDVFKRAAEANRKIVDELEERGRLSVLRRSQVRVIHREHVELELDRDQRKLPCDHIFVFAGGVLPSAFLNDIGVRTDMKFGTR